MVPMLTNFKIRLARIERWFHFMGTARDYHFEITTWMSRSVSTSTDIESNVESGAIFSPHSIAKARAKCGYSRLFYSYKYLPLEVA